ncbi:MAG: thioesterase family protein [Dehalococcoidia bacterium]|nr:thioesterase family protein [Dehalococcoidia bacterium]
MAREAFLRRDGDRYVPGDRARGPWNRETLHGRVLAGLIAHEVEQRYGDADFQFSRLTCDMFRVAPFAPLAIEVEAAREGNRIRVVDGVINSDGTPVARGSVVMLKRADEPEGNVWSPPDWDAPPPEEVAPPVFEGRPADWLPQWETRNISGGLGTLAPKRAWLRETLDLIEGVETSKFVSLAQQADFANPFANSGDAGLNYVNADLTLYLHRMPVDEWTGFEVASHQASEGVAVAECTLYDRRGAVGRATVCGVANRRT